MKRILLLILIVAGGCFNPVKLFAQEQHYPLFTEGEYFSLYAYPGMDVQGLLEKLNFDSFFQVNGLAVNEDSPRDITAKTFDAIYLEVSDTLGISAYAFKGKIKIFPDQETLAKEFRAIFRSEFFERAFYYHQTATLYVSYEDLTTGMLAHEMAHLIMSNYFIVPPSAKVQEILSGYVDYHFHKLLNISME